MLLVSNDITIDGNDGGAGVTIARTGGAAMRLFTVSPGASLTLENLTLANGLAQGGNGAPDGRGGGGGGAGLGGAVFNAGTLSAVDTTFTANQARGGTGGTGDGAVVTSYGGSGGGGLWATASTGPRTAAAWVGRRRA